MDDLYRTIDKESEVETKVKGSRFIGRTYLVATLDAMHTRLKEIKKREYNANHNCYAYIIGLDSKNRQFKYSDDGEPNGTAGKPIFDYISGRALTNTLVIVTRYFGGTKLGTGGLVKAYGSCADKTLSTAGLKENFINDQLAVELDFTLYNQLQKRISHLGATQQSADFSDVVKLKIKIRKSLTDTLISEIIELSSGKAKIEKK